ncbi:hypothetical protein FD754_002446, partial [Muntiacus muntjak]
QFVRNLTEKAPVLINGAVTCSKPGLTTSCSVTSEVRPWLYISEITGKPGMIGYNV